MSEKIKLFITEANVENQQKLKEIISGYPEFELYTIPEEPQTQPVRVVDEVPVNRTAPANQLTKRISDIFITVGIPAHIKGYHFLREAIILTIGQPAIINSITKELYPSVAKRFQTTASKVERAIRHAIEVGWARGKIENINNIFGVKIYGKNDRPTNGEFIALVADKMLVDGVS